MHSSLNYQPSAPVKIKPKVEILTWKVVQHNGARQWGRVDTWLYLVIGLIDYDRNFQRDRIHRIGGTYRTSKTVCK